MPRQPRTRLPFVHETGYFLEVPEMTTFYRHWLLSPCCLGSVLAIALLAA